MGNISARYSAYLRVLTNWTRLGKIVIAVHASWAVGACRRPVPRVLAGIAWCGKKSVTASAVVAYSVLVIK